ncbi:MAG TPA: DUF2188 domain-containing protein [Stellaceae bacterium]|nr:DUF2188 domain-containing protein [Stellaceae bacterium]
MLGRHVYRVQLEGARWTVRKEGEMQPLGDFALQEEAVAAAGRWAERDQPSRVVVADGDGAILDERLFGRDLSQELDAGA